MALKAGGWVNLWQPHIPCLVEEDWRMPRTLELDLTGAAGTAVLLVGAVLWRSASAARAARTPGVASSVEMDERRTPGAASAL